MKPSTTAFAASAFVVSTLAAMFSCASPGPKAALHEIFDQEWETRLAENPMRTTSAGRHEWDHLLPSVSAEDHERRAAVSRNFLDRLSQIERANLDTQDRINYDIFERQLRDSIADFEFGAHEISDQCRLGISHILRAVAEPNAVPHGPRL